MIAPKKSEHMIAISLSAPGNPVFGRMGIPQNISGHRMSPAAMYLDHVSLSCFMWHCGLSQRNYFRQMGLTLKT